MNWSKQRLDQTRLDQNFLPIVTDDQAVQAAEPVFDFAAVKSADEGALDVIAQATEPEVVLMFPDDVTSAEIKDILAKIDDDKKVDLIVGSTLINPTAAT